MHVLLIDRSKGKAKRRATTVLDSYAVRTGDASWATPITREALDELRAALRRSASKATCVGCYMNVGRSRMRLAWTVGRAGDFEVHGATPVATTRAKRSSYLPPWMRRIALLASTAGLAHDLGKAGQAFQVKLRAALLGKMRRDPVRHEWLSMQVLRRLRSGSTWRAAWKLGDRHGRTVNELPPFFRAPMSGWEDAVDCLVSSHHGLFGPLGGAALTLPDASMHIRADVEAEENDLGVAAALDPTLLGKLLKTGQRLSRFQLLMSDATDPGAMWWAQTLLARAALIFADHVVSARPAADKKAALYANTGVSDKGVRVLKQALDRHLDQVGALAGEVAVRMLKFRAEGLSPSSIETITQPSDPDSRFAWQNTASDFIARQRSLDERPMLVLNIASTGSGKTRMNARAVCALNTGVVRFCVALNLRSLTLQTGDVFRRQLGIGPDELAVVIGNPAIRALHEANVRLAQPDNTDENPQVDEYDAIGEAHMVPDWLSPWIEMHPAQRPLIGAPLLISTIDYLVAAGEPHLQQHHVSALLRLLSGSDLVLDEIDGYEPTALVAVLRLVQTAALCGRNVVASSATLSYPVACAVASAFETGVRAERAMRGEALGHPPSVIFISDIQKPAAAPADTGFKAAYEQYVEAGLNLLDGGFLPVHRRARTWPIIRNKGDLLDWRPAWSNQVAGAVAYLHRKNCWVFGGSSKRVSFGLVRVANINHGVSLARSLSSSEVFRDMTLRVACYHSQELLMHRHLQERRLDYLFSRSDGDGHIVDDPEISSIVGASLHQHVCFVVVATPVEEIGRDHDFDWSVIEPSSSQSIVQVSGRVNRHRLKPLQKEDINVLVLQLNHRALEVVSGLKGRSLKDRTTPVFCRPGLENSRCLYDQVEASELLAREFEVDARLRFRHQQYQFPRFDDASISLQLKEPMSILTSAGDRPSPVLLARQFYDSYRLRDASLKKQTLLVRLEDGVPALYREEIQAGTFKYCWVKCDAECRRVPSVGNAWLSWSVQELVDQCAQHGIDPDRGMQVEVPVIKEQSRLAWDASFGFHT